MRPIRYVRRGGDLGQFVEMTLQRANPGTIRELSGQEQGERRFIFLPVLDYSRLAMDDEGGRLALLNSADIEALRQGEALLLLDLSNEGPTFDRPIFDGLHANLDRLGVPRERVIFVSQNRLLRHDYFAAYGKGLAFWTFEYFVVLLGMWLDREKRREIFGDSGFDPGDYAPDGGLPDKPMFLCQNAAARWHRALVYRWLDLQHMMPDGVVSFHGIGSDNIKSHEFDLTSPPSGVAEAFPELLAGVEDWIPRKARRIDQGGWGNDLVVSIDLDSYARTDLTLITESDFFVPRIDRVTEKSIKAAASGKPFVLIGAPRSISRLAEFGFCTFDGLIDQSYDLIADPTERMKAVFESTREAWSLLKRDHARWRRDAMAMSVANFEHAQSGLYGRMRQTIIDPFVERMRLFTEAGIACP